MYLPSQTPLSEFDPHVFPPTLRQLVKSCWIETLEEFLSVTGVLRRSRYARPPVLLEMEAILPELNRWLPTDALEVWLNGPIDARSLGAECPEELLAQYMSMGSLRNDGVIAPMAAPSLPTGFRLPVTCPVRDQGERGICVACTVADFTQYVTHSSEPLSVDDIYARCKSFDGYIDDEGADLQTALGVAGRFGICPERLWRTRTDPAELPQADEEGGFPRVGNIRPVLRGVIEDYKTKLTGADGNVPMPIPVCVLVFESSLYSQATGLTGKWTLPLAGEAVLTSGHAMLIIGYQDDPSAPGGGYFIARNSWGAEYACDSPVDLPGHALLPYEYIRRFCFEAYTGPEMAAEPRRGENRVPGATLARGVDQVPTAADTPKVAEPEQVYIRKLDRDLRERMTNRVLHAGDRVIAHPDEPNTFCAYTDSNWKKFVANGYAWDESRQLRNIFPEPDAEQEKYIESVKAVSARFQSAIAANLNDFESVPFPLAGGLFVSRPQKIDRVEKLVDLSEELAFSLASVPEICRKSSMPNRWKSELALMTGMSVWGVWSGKKCCHVVTAFPVCVRFDVNKKPEFPTPNGNALDAIREQYDSWLARQKTRPDLTCFAMGSTFDLVDIVQGVSCPTCFSQFSTEANDHWKTASFNTGSVSLVADFFPDRLRPVSAVERMEQIRRVIDEKRQVCIKGICGSPILSSGLAILQKRCTRLSSDWRRQAGITFMQIRSATLSLSKRGVNENEQVIFVRTVAKGLYGHHFPVVGADCFGHLDIQYALGGLVAIRSDETGPERRPS